MIEPIFFNPAIWIVGVFFGLFFIAGIFLLVRGFILKGQGKRSYSDWRYENSFFGGGILTSIAVILAGVWFGWLLVPYESSFYQTYRITGELAEIQNAFDGDDGGVISQTYVARVEGVDLYIRSDDQRFRTLEVGDDVNLVCSKGFAFFQEPWYDCNFGG